MGGQKPFNRGTWKGRPWPNGIEMESTESRGLMRMAEGLEQEQGTEAGVGHLELLWGPRCHRHTPGDLATPLLHGGCLSFLTSLQVPSMNFDHLLHAEGDWSP